MAQLMEFEKTVAMDEIFNADGVADVEIQRAVEHHRIPESTEFKLIQQSNMEELKAYEM